MFLFPTCPEEGSGSPSLLKGDTSHFEMVYLCTADRVQRIFRIFAAVRGGSGEASHMTMPELPNKALEKNRTTRTRDRFFSISLAL